MELSFWKYFMDFETLPSEVKLYLFYDKVTYMDIMVHDTIKSIFKLNKKLLYWIRVNILL